LFMFAAECRLLEAADAEPALCFTKFQIPSYPLLARQARVYGNLYTAVTLDQKAHVAKVVSTSDSLMSQTRTILFPAVENSVRASEFSPRCARLTLKLVFHFVLDNGAAATNPHDTLWFTYPNEFFVTTSPQFYEPSRLQ